jgi:hypothetical protein
VKCTKCKKHLEENEAYEYRGVISCDEHFDDVCASRDHERAEIIQEEDAKLDAFKGMDLDPRSVIGKANREIFSSQLEVAKKESFRLRKYEGRE